MLPMDIVQAFLRQDQGPLNTSVSFRPGQIINGRILKLYPSQIAEVQFGAQKAFAQIETALEADKGYWFQVQPGEGRIHLKVLEASEKSGKHTTVESILQQFSLPASKENVSMIQFFIREGLPITKDTLQLTSEWLKNSHSFQHGLHTIKEILVRQLPFSKNIFLSLSAVLNGEPMSSMLEKLQQLLNHDNQIDSGKKITALITELNASKSLADGHWQNDANGIKEQIKHLIKTIGFTYENEIGLQLNQQDNQEARKIDTLKPLLMRLLGEELPAAIKDAAEKLLYKITGFQVLSQEIGPVQQFAVQIPVAFWDKMSDITMQWSGRKAENGKIDPNHCRVLFYLSLANLKETIVDLHIQNKVMNITIVNDNESIKKLAAPFLLSLKENLAKLNYRLSSVTFEKPENINQKNKRIQSLSSFGRTNNLNGLDLRI